MTRLCLFVRLPYPNLLSYFIKAPIPDAISGELPRQIVFRGLPGSPSIQELPCFIFTLGFILSLQFIKVFNTSTYYSLYWAYNFVSVIYCESHLVLRCVKLVTFLCICCSVREVYLYVVFILRHWLLLFLMQIVYSSCCISCYLQEQLLELARVIKISS